ncbi:hypothetical protein HD597_000533 [Nonomuraea thailandensis]|uniref:Uncharacterized protein n=1 Tax=Nonomuraea thailandensis TaxID=1188745 RepID=A0A9X2JY78_9ACTN|nr:hypothetical protein [Nonomuraea thailandensis]MCP2353513.1 hypothetical protein [Nonomuraea thailandensis]
MDSPALAIGATIPPPRFSGRQRLIMFVLLGAGFLLSIDPSISTVALEVGAGVGLRVSGLPWIASACALPAAAFILLLGRRTPFLSRMVVPARASVLGGFAASPETLLAAVCYRASPAR